MRDKRVFVAGHSGLVGSAVLRHLEAAGFSRLITRTHHQLDLQDQGAVNHFFASEKPDWVFLAAAKVGGIWANKTLPAEFIYSNLSIAVNVLDAAYRNGVEKLAFLGSSCIYPKMAPQPLKEEYLLSSPLEPTNEAYAIAKIAGLKMCRYYNQQYGTNFISVMPTNLFGPNDRYDLKAAHVLPALIRKFHLAAALSRGDWKSIRNDFMQEPVDAVDGDAPETKIRNALEANGIAGERDSVRVILWGSGSPRREFLYVDDLADALVFLMKKYAYTDVGEIINIGTGHDLTILELAETIRAEAGFPGTIEWDAAKPDGTPRKLLDVSRINSLGWSPRHALRAAIHLTCQDFRRRFGHPTP